MDNFMEKVTLFNEEGEEEVFEVITKLDIEDKEYLIVAKEDEEEEAIALRIDEDEDGEEVLMVVQDDVEFDMVAEAYEILFCEEEEE
ncbi:MAG: DUF1292 domain-containing protein [Clostridium sp.]